MGQPRQFQLTSDEVTAIQCDGTVGRDLEIADWMGWSEPYGEYRADRGIDPPGPPSFSSRNVAIPTLPPTCSWLLRVPICARTACSSTSVCSRPRIPRAELDRAVRLTRKGKLAHDPTGMA
jgi:hypothetical protein